jgi:hypothetical protein
LLCAGVAGRDRKLQQRPANAGRAVGEAGQPLLSLAVGGVPVPDFAFHSGDVQQALTMPFGDVAQRRAVVAPGQSQ